MYNTSMQVNYYRNIKDRRIVELTEPKAGSWIHVESPTPEDLEKLAKDLNLELDLLMDGIDVYELPRLEVDRKAAYIFTRYPYLEKDQIVTVPVLFVVTDKFIASICAEEAPFLEVFSKMKKPLITTQTNKALLEFLLEINHTYDKYLTKINKQIRAFEIRLQKIKNNDIVRFVEIEGVLNDFRPALMRMNGILESLTSGRYLTFRESDHDLSEDIMLSNRQLIEQTDDSIRTLKNIREAYTTIMTNNLNQVIKLLTSLTVVFTIPTMVASLYGMNVHLPFESHPLAFVFVVGFIAILTSITLYIFIKNDYF